MHLLLEFPSFRHNFLAFAKLNQNVKQRSMSFFKDRALMGIKKTFLLKNKAKQKTFVQPSLTSVDAGNWLRRILGIFQD